MFNFDIVKFVVITRNNNDNIIIDTSKHVRNNDGKTCDINVEEELLPSFSQVW
jgi:hypothetical protein